MKSPLTQVFTDRKILPFLIAVLTFGLVCGLYTGIFNNYLHEVLAMGKTERGLLELPRELPGLLLFVMMAFFYRFSEFKILRLALLFSLIGLAGLFWKGTLPWFSVGMISFWSMGEHLMMPVRKSVALHHSFPGKEGLAMGSVRGFHNIGQAAGYYIAPLIILILTRFTGFQDAFSQYRIIYLLAAALVVFSFFLSGFLKSDTAQLPRKRLYFHKKFRKYYLLEVFFGARKQVFLTFAPFVLILQYQASAELISLLYGIWSLTNIFIAPLVGRWVDKAGYKIILILDSLFLIILCLLYGFAHRIFPYQVALIVTCIVFVLDSMAFALGMARDIYAKSKSENREEFTSTLSTGLSVNHLVSILIAIGGGALWEALGVETLFITAALIGIGSLLFSLSLSPVSKRTDRG